MASPLDELKPTSAAARWQRLKADAAAELNTSTPGIARTPHQPLPEAALDAELPPSPSAASPLPDNSIEPAWLVPSRPLSPEEADLRDEPVPRPTPSVWRAAVPDWRPTVQRADAVHPTTEVGGEDGRVVSASAISPAVIWPLLPASDPRRQLRPIGEISPLYDVTVDREIRDYADKQASEYGVRFGAETFEPRAFPDTVFPWEASNFYHYPLYFEDPALERYGHTRGFFVQPFCSVGRFSAQLLALPYQMAIDPICEEVYALGWYRPGDCAPKLKYKVPWNTHAAVVEAGVVTGLIFLIP